MRHSAMGERTNGTGATKKSKTAFTIENILGLSDTKTTGKI